MGSEGAIIAEPAGMRILILDEDPFDRRILEDSLRRLGHTAIIARNASEALEAFARDRPDLIILDIVSSDLDGYELARRIRAERRERWTPIIFLSALDREEDIIAGFEAGGDDFIGKPFNIALLDAKLRSLQHALNLQRQAYVALKRVRALSDNVLDAIVTIDAKETIVAANSSCERIFGWKPSELIGRNLRVLMPEPFRSQHAGHVAHYVHGGAARIIGIGRESLAQHKDGTIFPIDLGVSEVRVDDERLFIGIMRDIRERKEAERKLLENAELLQRYHDEAEAEGELARSLIDRQLRRPGLDDPQLRYWLMPARNFSGDVVAAARSAEGRRYALLADATGHGLTAAISTLPVLSLFYSMAPTNASLGEIVGEINAQLCQSMPAGRFVAAVLVCIDEASGEGEIWNGGLPEALLLDSGGRVQFRFTSQRTPLGIIDSDEWVCKTQRFAWAGEAQLLLCSDGLLEATDASGDPFGQGRLLSALLGIPPAQRANSVRAALARHLGDHPAHDDVSLFVLDCPRHN